MKKAIRPALLYLLFFTILLGVMYPLVITGIAQSLFRDKANGSLITDHGIVRGSELIGQKFDQPVNFSSRPSASDYGAVPSGASNLGPTSQKLNALVVERRRNFARINGISDTLQVPVEMIFASGSGLDPHISPEAAIMQMDRIAKARNFTEAQKAMLGNLVEELTEKPQFLLLGEPRVNVFKLNLELNKIQE
jgi:K+-transporting ATPase ATPase C chain